MHHVNSTVLFVAPSAMSEPRERMKRKEHHRLAEITHHA